MQYKVPQNIDLEDKIVGPFTMKQFVYLLIGGFIIYGFYSFLSKNYDNFTAVFLLVAIPVGLICFAFVFVKVNDRPFEVFVKNIIKFLTSPKQRIWGEGYTPENVIIDDPTVKEKETDKQKDSRSLDEIAKSLEVKSKQAQNTQTADKQKVATDNTTGENTPVRKITNLSLTPKKKEETAK
ncbi:hypothetical protein COT77_01575 [Candidatus Berkelbacteria bacterium CG10_big_fil_rev_8_21_14_0_10_41_12]|uniref:PrgI family protein n=1 Tax=Candidatus Berkelbacteria bacterium CG10_big_fil_rev_8_21_14_0_10_41_12 TaxID=1974513 RepID=A0A2M6WX99_9BACT|nr:MAG: hypothetical protein COT77_01575 [Candidatus Berkelbacteria bacterium CG10_big_fil_rev_8_21_14_0_10_41_12]